MADKNNEYPDISGLFDIDKNELPDELIPKENSSGKIRTPFLTADEPKDLTKAEIKAENKQKKQEIRKKKKENFRKKSVIAISLLLVFIIAFEIISFFVEDSKKPVITAEKPIEETISRYYSSKGVAITINNKKQIMVIDNDYDVHYIEKGQAVELSLENVTDIKGTVTDIKEQSPDSEYIKSYAEILTGSVPSTPVYAVFITPENEEQSIKEGILVNSKIITKQSENTLTISSTAVQYNGNQPFVWIYSPIKKTLTKQDVKTGLSADGKTEITAGIKKSSRIVTYCSKDFSVLYEGIKVKHS